MDLKTFLDHFDTIAEAPGGIQKLRSLILDLAVRGKLVPQKLEDESVLDLLKRIGDEKKELIEKGEIRDNSTLPLGDNMPCTIPDSWIWQRLGNVILDIEAGISPQCEKRPKDESEWGVIKISAVSWDEFDPNENKALPATLEPRKDCEIKIGDFLMSRANTSQLVGKSVVVKRTPPKLLLNDKTLRVQFPTCLDKQFFNVYNNSLLARLYYAGVGTGTSDSMKNITREQIRNLPIPIPPLAEQKRIVEKVDELMALCDRLQQSQETRDTLRQKLRASAIDSLMNAETDEELKQGWAIVRDNWHALSQKPEDVNDLRRSVLQLAVRGKLVNQDPSEGKSIELVKMMLSRSSIKDVESNSPETGLWEVPESWAWFPLSQFGQILSGGTPSKNNPEFWSGDIPWISPKDMKFDYIKDSQDHISEKGLNNSSTKLIAERSVLMVIRGMILAHSFPVAVTKKSVTINQDIKALVPFLPETSNYLLICLKGLERVFLNLVQRSSHGTCRLPTEELFAQLIPLPPLAEQKRIVAKVDELMQMCDQLEESLRQSQQQAEALAASAISHLTLLDPLSELSENVDSARTGNVPLKTHNPLPYIKDGHNWTRTSDPYDVNVVL